MIRKQDIGVLIFYYLGYSRISNLILRFLRKPVARILAFHDIRANDIKNFKANLYLLKCETNVISLDDFFAGRFVTNKINTVITFDDGYKSWVKEALPLLQKLQLPATFFVSSGFVGLTKEEETEFKHNKLFRKLPPREISGGLSLSDIRKLTDAGFTIGGHTVNHSNLEMIDNTARLKFEILEDKHKLESMTGTNIKYFAYPSGDYRNPAIDITEVLQDAGYEGAVTTLSGSNTIRTNPYLLHRELTNAAMSRHVFKARVYGNYEGVLRLKRLIYKFSHWR